jgi:membrane fusion protein, copper/silver efflux system
VTIPSLPGTRYEAKVSYVYPFMEGASRTARVRLVLDNAAGVLRPDMYAEVHLGIDAGERTVVPEQAVLHAGESRVVFVDLGAGRLQPRRIRTGLRTREWFEVLEGLAPGEQVVTSGNFLVASESKLRSGIAQW